MHTNTSILMGFQLSWCDNFSFIAVYIDSLVMISIERSEKTQKNAVDV